MPYAAKDTTEQDSIKPLIYLPNSLSLEVITSHNIKTMLSNPKPRSLLHTREITFQGYAREDGLWDIEGHLKDFKTNPFKTSAKVWGPGEAFHDMWVRVTLDKEFVIQDIEAVMDGHPHAECTAVIPPMDSLIGAQIGKGWRKTIDTHLGGIKGCTHLRELLTSLATAAYQSIPGAFFDPTGEKPPLYLGTCKSWDFNGPVVMRVFPKFYRWKP